MRTFAVIPHSGGEAEADQALLTEYNTCHAPDSGKFCSTGGGAPDAFGFSQGKLGKRKDTWKPGDPIAVHRGVEIHALPHYTTPYYYAKHPRLGTSQHSQSIARVKRLIDKHVPDLQSLSQEEFSKLFTPYQATKTPAHLEAERIRRNVLTLQGKDPVRRAPKTLSQRNKERAAGMRQMRRTVGHPQFEKQMKRDAAMLKGRSMARIIKAIRKRGG